MQPVSVELLETQVREQKVIIIIHNHHNDDNIIIYDHHDDCQHQIKMTVMTMVLIRKTVNGAPIMMMRIMMNMLWQ